MRLAAMLEQGETTVLRQRSWTTKLHTATYKYQSETRPAYVHIGFGLFKKFLRLFIWVWRGAATSDKRFDTMFLGNHLDPPRQSSILLYNSHKHCELWCCLSQTFLIEQHSKRASPPIKGEYKTVLHRTHIYSGHNFNSLSVNSHYCVLHMAAAAAISKTRQIMNV
jgi:hypothetical protein